MRTTACARIRDELRAIATTHGGKVKLAWRAGLVVVLIGLLIYLSTLDFGDDPQSDSFEGEFFLGLISWVVIVVVGVVVVRWIRRTARRVGDREP